MFSSIKWSPLLRIDNQFSYLKTLETVTGNYSQIDSANNELLESYHRDGTIFHNEFKILYRSVSHYIGVNGKFLLMNQWKPYHDNDVKYFEENFEQSPYALKELLTNVHFNWDERTFYRVIDMSLRVPDVWIDANMDWTFCFGSLARNEIVQDNSKLISITDKDKHLWKNKTIKLDQLSSIEYSKSPNSLMTYVIVLGGNAKINSLDVSEDYIAKVESNSITIENVDNPVILIREKYDTF
jgi:hypothetical protein